MMAVSCLPETESRCTHLVSVKNTKLGWDAADITQFRNGPDLKSDDDGDGGCFGALVIPVLWIFVTPDFSWSATVMFTLVDKLTTAELFYVIKFAQTFAPPSTLLCIVFLLSTIRILAFPHKHTMCCFLRFFVTNILVVQSGDWTQGFKAVSYWEHQQI